MSRELKPLNRKCHCIIVEGPPGAGKTSLSRELGEALGEHTIVLLEPADGEDNANPYLSDYYADPKRWAFNIQIYLLYTRFQIHKNAQDYVMRRYGDAVLDRSYYGDVSFARVQRRLGLMDERDFETYLGSYHTMTASVLPPNICIRLLVSLRTSLRRIHRRSEEQEGRRCEAAITEEYIAAVDDEIGYTCDVLEKQGVRMMNVPWDTDRDTPEDRQETVLGLVERIRSVDPVDLYRDIHRRSI